MRPQHALAVAVLVWSGLLTAAGGSVALGAAGLAVEPDSLIEHVKFLASDELRGRASGTPELERAADYIALQFKDAGLQTVIGNSWYQRFEMDAGLTVGRDNVLVVRDENRGVTLTLGDAYYPLAANGGSSPDVASAALRDVPLIFAGFGISAPGLTYDDYAGLDVRGMAVIVYSHEPQEQNRSSRLNGNQPIPESSLYAKAAAARVRGAVALLVISDPVHPTDQADYTQFGRNPDADSLGIPVLRVRRTSMTRLLDGWNLDGRARAIDSDLRPRSGSLTGATITYDEFLLRNRRTVRNVIGVLPGTGPRAHEAIVIGAHYDHVGLGGRYSAAPNRTGEIHNGADDNASGTAAVIEMARVAAANPTRFGRTLVFVTFAGEEQGLLGSAHYVKNPPVPVANTVAMLNLDMVGRLRRVVDVSGLDTSPSLLADVRAAAREVGGLDFREEGPGAGRSDDSSFLDAQVPAIGFFTGFHRDYHRPTDDWDLVNAKGTAQVAQLALELAARLATRPERPEFMRRQR